MLVSWYHNVSKVITVRDVVLNAYSSAWIVFPHPNRVALLYMYLFYQVKSMCQAGADSQRSAMDGVKILKKTSGDSFSTEHVGDNKPCNSCSVYIRSIFLVPTH